VEIDFKAKEREEEKMKAIWGFVYLLIGLTVLIRYCSYDHLPVEPHNWGWWPAFGYAAGLTFLLFGWLIN
jgi:hypothetical protein